MQFKSKARYLRFSPYKLRPLTDVIRGKTVPYALNVLATTSVKRSLPIKKLLESAVANAQYTGDFLPESLIIKDIRVDEGPMYKYFKPGAMGRSNVYKKRTSHMSVILESKDKKKD